MANGAAIGLGIFFLVIAGIGFVYPVTDQGYSIVQVDEICSSAFGQLAQFFGGQSTQESCSQVRLMSYGVYGLGLIGIILVVAGAVVSRGAKPSNQYSGPSIKPSGPRSSPQYPPQQPNPPNDETNIYPEDSDFGTNIPPQKICQKCQAEISPKAKFCQRCGNWV